MTRGEPRSSNLPPRSTFAVLGFASTHDALSAEGALKAAGLSVVPIPAPAGIGDLCGLAMRLPPTQVERALEVLSAGSITPVARTEIEDY